MNAVRHDPAWIGVLDRVYAAALWLYPPAHRRRFGSEMRLAFRDRCREAARAGRGPARVLLAELLPDLARSVGVEHFDTVFQETNPMKRLLYALIATFVVVVALHSQVTPTLDALHRWNNHRLAVASERAYSAYMTGLAETTLQHRRSAEDDVAAAIFYREAARGHSPAGDDVAMDDAIGAPAAAALQDRADTAFAHARAVGNPWALWLAVRQCPARAAVCKPEDALARLAKDESDNAAVWAIELARAQAAGDTVRARDALARMARASQFLTQDKAAVKTLLAVVDRKPVPVSLIPGYAWDRSDPAASVVRWIGEPQNGYLFDEYTQLKAFSDFCRASDPAVHAQRRADCRAAGRLLVDRAQSYFGYFAWMRNADPGEIGAARDAFRVHAWRTWGVRQWLSQRDRLEFTAAMWRAHWTGHVDDAALAIAEHAPVQPPESFRLRPEQYDPWN